MIRKCYEWDNENDDLGATDFEWTFTAGNGDRGGVIVHHNGSGTVGSRRNGFPDRHSGSASILKTPLFPKQETSKIEERFSPKQLNFLLKQDAATDRNNGQVTGNIEEPNLVSRPIALRIELLMPATKTMFRIDATPALFRVNRSRKLLLRLTQRSNLLQRLLFSLNAVCREIAGNRRFAHRRVSVDANHGHLGSWDRIAPIE
ncbi:hypothetical protein HAX54_030332 [Datura stramonium]|uniref:Uncharacterized protein n=1 Tax=Datura stramonium TaxID=4076 RepID=A0ABS8VAZ4_DATST|nr:hypothetical protein [Datura stramonium]